MLAAFLVAVIIAGAWTAVRRIQALESRIDASERTREELAAKLESLERQQAIDVQMLSGLGEGLMAIDRDQRIAIANRRFGELFNLSESVIGKLLGEVIRVSAVFEAFDRAREGQESVERFSVRSGILERKIEMRALPLPSDDIAAVALFIDVTKIERLERIRRNFIADFSHEVRTPLAGLRSAVETFEASGDRLSGEEDHHLRRIMARQLNRLERLVDDLSELSRIESGDVALELDNIDLRATVAEVIEDFAEQAAHHRIEFDIRGNRVMVCADPLRIQQAFSNLIDNAIKYGGDGKKVIVEVADENNSGVVRVIDQGEGIPDAERTNVFRRFYRIDKSRSQEIPGSGLGLAIAKHLILQHHGSIDVQSDPGSGATFIVRLPKSEGEPSLHAAGGEGSRR